MGKWYDWYENQKQWDKMLNQVNESTRSDVQTISDTHAAAERAKYDYPWKDLSMIRTATGNRATGNSLEGMLKMAKLAKNFRGAGGSEAGAGTVGSYETEPIFGGVVESGGSEAGGMSAGGIAAIIAAVAYGQHKATENTDREFEGVKTGDAFTLQFGHEPWYVKLADQWGYDTTDPEKFDAAVANADYWTALRRLPATADYWADPVSTYLWDAGKNQWGSAANWLDPVHGLLSLIAE